MAYKKNNIIRIFCVFATIILLLSGCNTTKYVPENERLLSKVKINNSENETSKQEIKLYIRQQENVKILGFWKLYLGIYNLSGQNEEKGINKWFRKIGEEPVIFDSTMIDVSLEQMKLFFNNQGYYMVEVSDTVVYPSKKKAKVIYNIKAGSRYRIKDVSYKIEDDSLRNLILADTINTLLRRGRPFSVELHNRERERITRNLVNQGFYSFSKEYIYFNVDSLHGNYTVSDTMIVMKPVKQSDTDLDYHTRYSIRDVSFLVGGDSHNLIYEGLDSLKAFDTWNYMGYNIIYANKLDFNPNVLINSNYINKGDIYRADLVERTRLLLNSLRLFRFINIRFEEIENAFDDNGNKQIDCIIHLIQGNNQSYSFDIEGTNSSGNLGAAGSLKYQHKNIFNGAELFSTSLRLARQDQFVKKEETLFNTVEIGGDASVVFPKFILPIRIEKFRQRFNPYTNVSISYNYQSRPDYTRTIASARVGYSWRASQNTTHSFSLIDFNLVNIPHVSPDFWKYITNSTFLQYAYEDHLILNTNYTVIYNQQTLENANRNFWYIRYNIESAGNLLNLLVPLNSKQPNEDYYNLFGIRYAQYIKSEIDLRYNQRINRLTSVVYRVFGGVGIPYGNLNILPFEKRYFSGGAYSLRAWPVRGLGPGSNKGVESNFYNQTADIKLEANLEYRFKLFWILEGAFYLDAGNIWDIRSETAREGGLFKLNEFYKQIAIGTGFGMRFDFKYFIFRLDPGLKIYDPSEKSGERWIPFSRSFTNNDFAFNFAIGYPF